MTNGELVNRSVKGEAVQNFKGEAAQSLGFKGEAALGLGFKGEAALNLKGEATRLV